MPFDGSAWKRWEEDPERLGFKRHRAWLHRFQWAMVCIEFGAALSLLAAAALGD
jgi:hypothetical protein